MLPRINVFVLYITILLTGVVQAQEQLSREHARDLILKSKSIQDLSTIVHLHSKGLGQGRDLGLWTIARGKGSPTEKGRMLISELVRPSRADAYVKLITPSDVPSVEVTGITDARGGGKLAEFSWKYKNLPQEIQPFACAGGTGGAIFKLYDDGWRIIEVGVEPRTDLPYVVGEEPPSAPEVRKSDNNEALPAASADTPPIKTGDTYIIESLYSDNPTLNNTTERKVISVGEGQITVASRNIKSKTGSTRTIRFTPEWNVISSRNPDGSGLDYSPPLKYFEFPLYPGKTWRQTSVEKNTKTGAVREHTLSATVGDWEDVSVSAGTFHAIKITTQTELLDRATGQRSTGTDISWYAPNIRRSVKSEVTSQNFQENQERQLIQMIQYDLE